MSIKFSEWSKKTEDTYKQSLIILKVISMGHKKNSMTLAKLLKTISKSFIWNRTKRWYHMVLGGLYICKNVRLSGFPWSEETKKVRSFQTWEELWMLKNSQLLFCTLASTLPEFSSRFSQFVTKLDVYALLRCTVARVFTPTSHVYSSPICFRLMCSVLNVFSQLFSPRACVYVRL